MNDNNDNNNTHNRQRKRGVEEKQFGLDSVMERCTRSTDQWGKNHGKSSCVDVEAEDITTSFWGYRKGEGKKAEKVSLSVFVVVFVVVFLLFFCLFKRPFEKKIASVLLARHVTYTCTWISKLGRCHPKRQKKL